MRDLTFTSIFLATAAAVLVSVVAIAVIELAVRISGGPALFWR